MTRNSWLFSLIATALAVACSLWLWFGPWLWPGIPWLVMGALPFAIGLFVPRIPLLFGQLPFLVPFLMEQGFLPSTLTGMGASWIATGLGIMVRRLITMGGESEHDHQSG